MPLIHCPECRREISTAAEACPGCGHPMRVTADAPAGPKCYTCSSAATTRCQSCGALSCALHLNNIWVQHGKGGANELRCEPCYSRAVAWKVFGGVLFVIVLVVILAMWSSAGQP